MEGGSAVHHFSIKKTQRGDLLLLLTVRGGEETIRQIADCIRGVKGNRFLHNNYNNA